MGRNNRRRGVRMVRAADAKEVGVENSAEETYHNPDLFNPMQQAHGVNDVETKLSPFIAQELRGL